jgi:hypothetical protein
MKPMTTPSTTDLDKAIAALEACIAHFGDENPDDDWAAIQDARAALPDLIALRDGAGAVKPLDLSNLLRAAFLSGRGLKNGQKMTADDQRAWANWADDDLFDEPAFQRINAALGVKPFPTPPASHGEG